MHGHSDANAVAKWTGLVGSLLTFVLGIVHICDITARIYWPSNVGFITDVNRLTWRDPLFTLNPIVMLDVWTPFIFGAMGLLAHTEKAKRLEVVTESFLNYFIFNMICGLFATIGYNGGLGIIFCIPVFLAALFSGIVLIMQKDANASLKLNNKFKPGNP